MIILNAFSANMIAEFPATVQFAEVDACTARTMLMCAAEEAGEMEFVRSAVGHADTAAVFSAVLGIPVECRRETVTLKMGDAAVLGQYSGPRLPEGCRTLPAGAAVKWIVVTIA